MSMMGPDLLGRLVDEQAPALVLYARQWCVSAEDVVQEAFLKLAAQRALPACPAAWLYRVVRNLALTAARSARRRRHHEVAAAQQMAWFENVDDATLDGATAAAALQGLPLDEREVIIAHLWGGLTFEQIAELAGCSASTAHRRYLAGLSSLRERLRIPCPTTIPTDS